MDMAESDSDFECYTDTSDSDDQYDTESSYGGHALSILSNLDDSIDRIDGYLAFERGFVHGDIVRSAMDPSGQMGRIVNVDMIIDLEGCYGDVVKNVNSKQLLRARSFTEGDYVVCRSWLGKVETVYDLVEVLLDDGTRFAVSTRGPERIIPVSPSFPEDGPYAYSPGQRVEIRKEGFKSSWLCGSWNSGHNEGIVHKVEVGSVLVKWIASAIASSGSVPPAPSSIQDAKSLVLLSCFPHANWKLGDWCKLPLSYFWNSGMTAEEQVPPGINPLYATDMKPRKMKNHQCDQTYVITKTKTNFDVLWQDGSLSVGLDAQTLVPVGTISDYDFWPEQFVLDKTVAENVNILNIQRLGIVKYVDSKERIVRVKWIVEQLNQAKDHDGNFTEDTVSAYELIEHPDFSYCMGDLVFRLSKQNSPVVQTDAEFCISSALQTDGHECFLGRTDHHSHGLLQNGVCTEDVSSEDSGNNVVSYLPCVGNVIGFKGGLIEVRWANGIMSKVEPAEIIAVDKFESPASSSVLSVDATEVIGTRMSAEPDKQSWYENEKELLRTPQDPCVDSSKNLWDTADVMHLRAAISFFTNMATGLFGLRGSKSLYVTTNSDGPDSLNRGCNLELKSPAFGTKVGFDELGEILEEHTSKIEDVVPTDVDNSQVSSQENLLSGVVPKKDKPLFKKFDIVGDYSDHHFANGIGKELALSQVKRSWLKKVHQEWSILEKDLPDTIHVRVYEERIDLLRASIIGAAGTPYHDALFFFDICFPPEYPHEPPMVHYISGGLRLNPNLYESGRVCLSLLKTWTGTGTEVWNPGSSTILQVLLSIQALVLNAKPYFNEAGYDKQMGRSEGERNSITYNENAFLLSRNSMLYHLCKPPKHFEALVDEHFSSRWHHILSACKVHMDGSHEGYDFGCGEVASEGQRGTSTGFKIMLTKLFQKLISAFSERGIDCSQFDDHALLPPEMGNEAS